MPGEQFNILAEEHCRRAPPVRADGAGLTEGQLPGLRLTMSNGEVWFHPFTGNRGAPWRLTGEEDAENVAAYAKGYSDGNRHDNPYDPRWDYTDAGKSAYQRGFSAGRETWVAGKSARAWAARR